MSMNAMKLDLEEMETVNGGLNLLTSLSRMYDLYKRLEPKDESKAGGMSQAANLKKTSNEPIFLNKIVKILHVTQVCAPSALCRCGSRGYIKPPHAFAGCKTLPHSLSKNGTRAM